MVKTEKNKDLRDFNSFGIGARCTEMISFTTAKELIGFLRSDSSAISGKWDVLGGGNNILFTGDYHGTLIHPEGGHIEVVSENASHALVRVDAGVVWDDFVEWCVEAGLWGAENLSHIPSQTGAAPVQNIGAYGAEAKDIVVSVETLDVATLKLATIAAEYCSFGYRDSIFKHSLRGKVIITAVNFRLGKTPAPNVTYGALAEEVEKLGGPALRNIRDAVINIRCGKLPEPSELGNAGSFFKNPVVDATVSERLRSEFPDMPLYPSGIEGRAKLSAGWLIERTGWKGASRGNAGVYPKQALILVNNGGASGAEIVELAREIKADVRAAFGVDIEPEVNIW